MTVIIGYLWQNSSNKIIPQYVVPNPTLCRQNNVLTQSEVTICFVNDLAPLIIQFTNTKTIASFKTLTIRLSKVSECCSAPFVGRSSTTVFMIYNCFVIYRQTTTDSGVIWVNCPQCRRESILKWEKK